MPMPVRQNRRAFVRSMGLLPLALARAGPVQPEEQSLAFRLAIVLVPAPLVQGGARESGAEPPFGADVVARLDLNLSGPVLTRLWWRLPLARPRRASRKQLCSRRALSHRLVGWCGDHLSGVGSTGRGRLETRRSSVWLSSTSRNFCA